MLFTVYSTILWIKRSSAELIVDILVATSLSSRACFSLSSSMVSSSLGCGASGVGRGGCRGARRVGDRERPISCSRKAGGRGGRAQRRVRGSHVHNEQSSSESETHQMFSPFPHSVSPHPQISSEMNLRLDLTENKRSTA